jgi:hypothetical protein
MLGCQDSYGRVKICQRAAEFCDPLFGPFRFDPDFLAPLNQGCGCMVGHAQKSGVTGSLFLGRLRHNTAFNHVAL